MRRKRTGSLKAQKGFFFQRLFLLFLLLLLVVGLNLINSSISKNTCANSISCINDLSGQVELGAITGEFHGQKVTAPPELAEALPPTTSAQLKKPDKGIEEVILGESSTYKRIQVDLTNQKIYAYEGESLVYESPISTGKWAPTPTGTFRIWVKLKAAKMEGGSRAINTYYYLPNVPHIMYFYNESIPKTRGFGIHGAYWHNNFGHPMSHGCVNLPLDVAEKFYEWADPPSSSNATYANNDNPGTRIIIYGQAPTE